MWALTARVRGGCALRQPWLIFSPRKFHSLRYAERELLLRCRKRHRCQNALEKTGPPAPRVAVAQ